MLELIANNYGILDDCHTFLPYDEKSYIKFPNDISDEDYDKIQRQLFFYGYEWGHGDKQTSLFPTYGPNNKRCHCNAISFSGNKFYNANLNGLDESHFPNCKFIDYKDIFVELKSK